MGNLDIRGCCELSSGGCRLAPGGGCFLLALGWVCASFRSLLQSFSAPRIANSALVLLAPCSWPRSIIREITSGLCCSISSCSAEIRDCSRFLYCVEATSVAKLLVVSLLMEISSLVGDFLGAGRCPHVKYS